MTAIEISSFSYSPFNPTIGRFLSEEPLGIDGPNLYWYARNNPINYIDPNGLITYGVGLGAGIAAAGASFSGDIQLVKDDKGNVGIAITGCLGGVTEAAGVTIGGINAVGS